MASWWPWAAVAGAGALHGMNPINGWMLAAGWGTQLGDWRRALHALVPIATGHVASIAVVATAVALGHPVAQWCGPVVGISAVLFAALFWRRLGCRTQLGLAAASAVAPGRLGMALWSFVASTLHGSGMMLVPALVPLCLGDSPARALTASGSLPIALAAVAVHAAAMLGAQAFASTVADLGFNQARRWRTKLGRSS